MGPPPRPPPLFIAVVVCHDGVHHVHVAPTMHEQPPYRSGWSVESVAQGGEISASRDPGSIGNFNISRFLCAGSGPEIVSLPCLWQHEHPDGRLIVHRPAGHQYGLGDGSFEVFERVKGEQQQQHRVVQELRPGFY